ncbi:hypothetical protein BDQ17DRAFT_1410526 [Cyathus striatus]|nr:hypothetical protein BDQ17DRAFT_1410526 [Cyathus striatus]
MVSGSKTTTGSSLLAAPTPIAIEESRAQRLQRQQARFRDRGGIFVPTNRNTLADILLGRNPTQRRSPRKSGRNVTLSSAILHVGSRSKATSNSREERGEVMNSEALKVAEGGKLTRISPEKSITHIKSRPKKESDKVIKRRGRPPKASITAADIMEGRLADDSLAKETAKGDRTKASSTAKVRVSRQRTSAKKSARIKVAANCILSESDGTHKTLTKPKGKDREKPSGATYICTAHAPALLTIYSTCQAENGGQSHPKAKVRSTCEVDSVQGEETRGTQISQFNAMQSNDMEVSQKPRQGRTRKQDKCKEVQSVKDEAILKTKRQKVSALETDLETTDVRLAKPNTRQAEKLVSNMLVQGSSGSSNEVASVLGKSLGKRSRKIVDVEDDEEKKPIVSKPKKRPKVETARYSENNFKGKHINSKILVQKVEAKGICKGRKIKKVTAILPMPSVVLEILRRPQPIAEDDEPDPIDFLS